MSVRNLVEFILREGDIDNRKAGGLDKDAMLRGGRIHRKIQRQMGAGYRAEVSLKYTVPCDGFELQIEGRADGIIAGTPVVIDEIKGVLKDVSSIETPTGVHLAQAKCYAYIYAKQHQMDSIGVQMTYCNLDTEEIRRFQTVFSLEELNDWFENLVRSYEKWARFEIEWKKQRNATIKQLEFPYEYREGQRDIAVAVYRTILHEKKMFVQAPTGVGKTISTVFPSVKAIGEGLAEKLFYLTAKTITRTVAEQAFRILRENQLKMKVVTLTAKEKICFCEETTCNPDMCPYAKGHFDRVNDAVYQLLMDVDEINRKTIEEQAKKFRVCPFELSLDVSTWVDGIICDYNYAFDPTAHLKRFFSEGAGKEYIFLVDEAHNLVERGREMYSAQLYKEDFLELKKTMKLKDSALYKKLGDVNRLFLGLKRECERCEVLNSVSHIVIKLLNLMSEMERYLEEASDEYLKEQVLNLYFEVRSFINIHELLDDDYIIYSEFEPDGRFKIKLFCVNPARNLQEYLKYGAGTIFFSATLLPVHYYKKLLSMETDDYAIYAKSPFSRNNKLVLLGRDVSTKYTLRSVEMYEKIASYIWKAISVKSGNYLVFFPSYRLMEDVYSCFEKIGKNVEVLLQKQGMNEEEREQFLSRFEKNRKETLIGFCVMGGIFSEGIDLTEDRLIGALIIGTGLPQVCNERELVKQYFDKNGESGFDYSYLYPGMNKVLQSAGRVIRTENDRGIILLLDERFMLRQYRELFPREWEGYQYCTAETLENQILQFWK